MKKICLLLVVSFFLFETGIVANNVVVGTPSVSGNSITFTIQWDNSWNLAASPANWDAVWVFVKYENCSNSLWQHADLSTVSTNHSVTGGVLQVDAVTDGKGVFIRRSANGSGNIAASTVTLQMAITDAGYNYQVFAIEMVNVPQGDYYLGDGVPNGNNFSGSGWAPVLITNAMQNSAGLPSSSYLLTMAGLNLPTTFPMGWNSFYCMKYEISQAQYVAFLNTLTFDQQYTRTNNTPGAAVGTQAIGVTSARNGIRVLSYGINNTKPAVYMCDLNANNTPNEAADGQDIACNFLKWDDLAAYLDWAALRPMTEFEFEKACRGPMMPTNNEPPWGSVVYTSATSVGLSNAGTSSEISTTSGNGLSAYNGGVGPLRCGFAATASTNRLQSGATYYGIMDMGGNLLEQTVGIYSTVPSVTAFTNACGDGALTTAGLANTPNWLASGGAGTVSRGGDWADNNTFLNVSMREYLGGGWTARQSYVGGRGVR